MNNDEMIAKFLKTNKAEVCEDAELIETGGYGVNKRGAKVGYSVKGVNARNVRKFNCEICGKEDSAVKNDEHSNKYKKGYVDGVFKGDCWCWQCRSKKSDELQELKAKAREAVKLFDGDIELYNLWREANITYCSEHESIGLDKLVALRDNFALCITKVKPLKHKQSMTKKIAILSKIIDKKTPAVVDNWDDWDAPLGG